MFVVEWQYYLVSSCRPPWLLTYDKVAYNTTKFKTISRGELLLNSPHSSAKAHPYCREASFDSLVPLGIIVEVALSKVRIIPSKLFLFLRVTTQPTKLAPINQQYLVLRKWLVGKTGHKSHSFLLHTKSHERACALQNKSYTEEQ